MNLKLDENFSHQIKTLLESEGHDVDTVRDEGLIGARDEAVFSASQQSGRTLITLDLDFSNPLRFSPEGTPGIIVVRPPRAVLSVIRATVMSILPQLGALSAHGMLWIVEPGRLRTYDPRRSEESP